MSMVRTTATVDLSAIAKTAELTATQTALSAELSATQDALTAALAALPTGGAEPGEIRQFTGPVPAGWQALTGTSTLLKALSWAALPNRTYSSNGSNAVGFVTNSDTVAHYLDAANHWGLDRTTRTYTAFSGIPNSVSPDCGAATLSDGRALVVGGLVSNYPTKIAQIYSPSTDSWTRVQDLPEEKSNAGVALLPSGRVLVVGGYNGAWGDSTSAYAYNASTGAWATLAVLPTTGVVKAAALPSGKIAAVVSNRGGSTISLRVYDEVSDTWSTKAPPSFYVEYAVLLSTPSGVRVIGGSTSVNGEATSTTLSYTESTDTWANEGSFFVSLKTTVGVCSADGTAAAYVLGQSGAQFALVKDVTDTLTYSAVKQ